MNDLDLRAYAFELPPALIAQHPAERRDASRMMVLDRRSGDSKDRVFSDILEHVQPEDVLVLNNTKVFPARLVGTREPGGGRAELFLVRPGAPGTWTVLAKPGRKLQPGARIRLSEDVSAVIEDVLDDGKRHVRFMTRSGQAPDGLLDELGRMPLPPYIRREKPELEDRERYQTVYAKARGAIAAPTAGLHFTKAILDRLRAQGTTIAEVTLHVGYGTFEPVHSTDLRSHAVSAEQIEVSPEAAAAINAARKNGGRIIAVGTTTTRTLEATVDADGVIQPFRGEATLTITPGYTFRAIDALLTNFHLPESSLLVLVSAFAGRKSVLAAYERAVAEGYRFYSYGDCMLLV